jgi:hypothetical protein
VVESSRAVLLLTLLTVLAFGVRRVGVDFGVPLWEEGDSHIPAHVDLLRKGRDIQARRVDNIQYPSFLARVVSLAPPRELEDPASATLEEHLAVARGTSVQVRTLIALISVLAIPGTYLLARRFMRPAPALFAAAVLATSLQHLNFSQQARPHAAFASLLLWTTLASMRVRRRPTAGSYLLAGCVAAMAVGCLHSGALALLPLLAAHLLREGEPGRPRRLFEPRALLALLPVAAAIPLFYTFLFQGEVMEEKHVFRIENGTIYLANHHLNTEMFDLYSGFVDSLSALWRWDPTFLVLLALAAGSWVAARASGVRSENRGDLRVALAFVVPYSLLIGIYTRTYERFLLPLYPFLACAAAWGAARLVARAPARMRTALAGVFVLALFVPGYVSSRWAWLRSEPDTCELVGQWVLENVEPGAERIFVFPPWDLPISRLDSSLRLESGRRRTSSFSQWNRYQIKLDESERPPPLHDVRWFVLDASAPDIEQPEGMREFLDRLGPGIYVIQVAVGGRSSRFDPVLRAELQRRGTLELRISPDPDPYFSDHPLMDEDEEVEDWPYVFTRVLRAHAVGPVLEVYRVP